MRLLIAAHRGLSGNELENSAAAFAASAARGVEAVEFDVRRTGDGVLVIWHDATAAGLPVSTSTYAELATRTPSLCTFAEALGVLPKSCLLDVEIKVGGFEQQVLRELEGRRDKAEFVVTSFRDEVVARVKALDAGVRTGLVLGRGRPRQGLRARLCEWFPTRRLRRCGAELVVAEFPLLHLGFAGRMLRHGYPVWVWTVNDARLIGRLLRRPGVAAVITDRPVEAMALRAGAA